MEAKAIQLNGRLSDSKYWAIATGIGVLRLSDSDYQRLMDPENEIKRMVDLLTLKQCKKCHTDTMDQLRSHGF